MINWWPELKVKFRLWELTPQKSPGKIKAVETKLSSGICQFRWFVQGYFGWQQSLRVASEHSWGSVSGLPPVPCLGGMDKGPECACVGGSRVRGALPGHRQPPALLQQPPCGLCNTSAALLIRHHMSNLETCIVLHSVQWCNRRENLCCFHGSLCVGPWLEGGSRMLSVPE